MKVNAWFLSSHSLFVFVIFAFFPFCFYFIIDKTIDNTQLLLLCFSFDKKIDHQE